jgi:serine/threonine protein kinase/WD40 repeat protein
MGDEPSAKDDRVEPLREAFDLFLEICDLPADARARELDVRCVERPALRATVERLIERERRGSPEAALRTGEGGEATMASLLPAIAEPSAGVLAGRYRLSKLLGEGGSGAVYEAEQISPRRPVALKIFRASVITGESALRRFALEAEVLARLQHPSIAQVYDAGFGPSPMESPLAPSFTDRMSAPACGPAWIAMELVRGRPLDVAARTRALDHRTRLELFLEVCDAVAFAHQKGVIHRDLKPANILLTEPEPQAPQGRIKVLDFGIARVAGPEWQGHGDDQPTPALTGPGQLLGTLPYMSPEQVAGDGSAIDVRSDVYSLGVILYELLVGRRPFDLKGRAIDEAVRVVRDEDPAPPSMAAEATAGLRGDLDAIVLKSLAKDPDERYRSVAALADDLRAHLAGEPVAARANSAMYVLVRKARRHRLPIAASVLLIISIVVVAVRATFDAERFSQLAEDARISERAAQRASEALARQLNVARVERARLLAATGNVADAVDALRSEGVMERDPRLRWAAREIAARHPCLRSWEPHVASVRAAGLSDDGRLVLSAGEDGRVALSDIDRGVVLCVDIGSPILSGAHDREGKRFVVGCENGSVLAFDDHSLEPLPSEATHTAPVRSIAARDGVTVSGDGSGRVLFHRDGEPLRELTKRSSAVTSLLLLPGGDVAIGDEGGDVAVIHPFNGSARPVTRHDGAVLSLAFDARRERLLSGATDRTITIVSLDNPGEPSRSADVGNGSVRVIAVDNPSGDILVSGWWSLDRWDESLRSRRRIASPPFGPNAVVFAPESGRALSAHHDGTMRLWVFGNDPINGGGVFVPGVNGRVSAVLSRDGSRIAVGDGIGNVVVADAQSGAAVTWLPSHGRRVRGIDLSSDGRYVASAADDRMLQVGDAQTGEVLGRRFGVEPQMTSAVAFSPDGRRLAVAFGDRTVRVMDLPGLSPVASFVAGERQLVGIAWSPDGERIATTSRDLSIRVFTSTGEPLAITHTPDAPWALAFSPDGSRLAVGEWSRSIAIFDATTLSLNRRFAAGGGLVTAVVWLPPKESGENGLQAILAASGDGNLRVHDASDGRSLFEFTPFSHADTISCSVDATGRFISASGTAGEIGVWDTHQWDEWARRGTGLR